MARLEVYLNNQLLSVLLLSVDEAVSQKKKWILGRRENCDFIFETFPGISREHLEVSYDGTRWILRCLSDKRLITVDQKEHPEIQLRENTDFIIKPYRLRYKLDSEVAVLLNKEILKTGGPENQLPYQPQIHPEMDADEITKASDVKLYPFLQMTNLESREQDLVKLEGHAWVAGRDSLSDIVLQDGKASRRHFELFINEEKYFIKDLGASNGTYLNGRKLDANEGHEIVSGDLITINVLQITFQLRDISFQDNFLSAPRLDGYSSPSESGGTGLGGATLLGNETNPSGSWKTDPGARKKIIYALCAVVLLIAVAAKMKETDGDEKGSAEQSSEKEGSEFDKLNEDQKRQVLNSYQLAKNLFMQGKYELALSQLEKVHALVPAYKDSKQIEEYCHQSRELKLQQEFIQQQKDQQRQIREKIDSVLEICRAKLVRSIDVEEIKTCLAPALELDPSLPEIQEILATIEAKVGEIQRKEQEHRGYLSGVSAGEHLFEKARELEKKKDYFGAIDAYRLHIRAGHPDPHGLKEKSKQALSSIQAKIKSEKDQLFAAAKGKHKAGQKSAALLTAKQALDLDPQDRDVQSFISKVQNELMQELKNLYTDSILEERFGNIEAAKGKWKEILEKDLPSGDYAQRARNKLSQYGEGQ